MRRLLLLLCGAAALQAEEAPRLLTQAGADSTAILRARGAMWRSMALPGWGQAYNGEWVKAAAFAGAELGILIGARQQHRNWQDWKKRRAEAFLGEDEAYQEFSAYREEFYLTDRNKLLWWWLWLRMASVLDAYVSGHLSNYDDSLDLSVSPGAVAGEAQAGIRLTLSWQP